MKANIIFCLVFISLVGIISPLKAVKMEDPPKQEESKSDDWNKETVEEKNDFPYMKEKYEMVLTASFEDVWNTCKKAVELENCMIIVANPRQNDAGLYLGKIESDYCLFAQGDTTARNLKYFSFDMPFIRGGVWATGRMQYKFICKENEDRTVNVRIIGELSGLENLATKRVHFWKSNGYLETMMMEKVKKMLAEPKN